MSETESVLLEQQSPIITQDEPLGLVSGERQIEQDSIRAITQKLGEFFNLPEEIIEKSGNIPIVLVTEDKMGEIVVDNTTIAHPFEPNPDLSPEALDAQELTLLLHKFDTGLDDAAIQQQIIAEKNKAMETIKGESSLIEGFHADKSGQSTIYIKATPGRGNTVDEFLGNIETQSILTHELIHALANKEKGEGTGFKDTEGNNDNLNEAATQALTLHFQYPSLTPHEMLQKIQTNEIPTYYRNSLMGLLIAMAASCKTEKPITFSDLAESYFEPGDPDINQILFMMELMSRAPETTKQFVSKIQELFNKRL